MTERRVFLLEEPRGNVNLETAKAFGPIKYVFGPDDRRCSVFKAGEFGHAVVRKLREARFDAVQDRFCLTGALVPVCIAVSAILAEWGMTGLLLWNAPDCCYVDRFVRTVEFTRQDLLRKDKDDDQSRSGDETGETAG